MIELNQRIIGFINIFEKVTRARVKDCFEEQDSLVFVVQEGEIFKAVGKGGENVRKLSHKFKKKVKVIAFDKDVRKFTTNLLYPLKPEMELEGTVLKIKSKDNKEKGLIYGRDRSNLKRVQKLVSKYFKVTIELV